LTSGFQEINFKYEAQERGKAFGVIRAVWRIEVAVGRRHPSLIYCLFSLSIFSSIDKAKKFKVEKEVKPCLMEGQQTRE